MKLKYSTMIQAIVLLDGNDDLLHPDLLDVLHHKQIDLFKKDKNQKWVRLLNTPANSKDLSKVNDLFIRLLRKI